MQNIDLTNLGAISMPVLLALGLNFIGYGLVKTERFQNKYIPLTLMLLGGIVYPFLGTVNASVPSSTAALIVQGITIGGLSVAFNQQFRQFLPKNE